MQVCVVLCVGVCVSWLVCACLCICVFVSVCVCVMLILRLHSAVIPTVLAKNHTIRKRAVSVEEIDLHKIWQPYLIVKGFPPFVNDQLLKQHFQTAANGAEIQSIEMKKGEASITYVNPQGKGTRTQTSMNV